MAVKDYALTTLADVKAYGDTSSLVTDAVLEQLIDDVSDWIESQLGGRRIKEYTWTDELYDGGTELNRPDRIYLRNRPVVSITSIEDRTGDHIDGTFDTVNPKDYLLYPEEGYIEFPAGLRSGRQNYKITYVAGYSEIPGDLNLLAKQLVLAHLDRNKAQGKTGEDIEGFRIDWGSIVRPDQKKVLLKYREYAPATRNVPGTGAVVV